MSVWGLQHKLEHSGQPGMTGHPTQGRAVLLFSFLPGSCYRSPELSLALLCVSLSAQPQ